ncbi:MAG: type II toxin-antitoxin system RelE/ParE family toxin [Stellaceae bacterium]
MRVVWTAPAARDLESIGDYIARQNSGAARRTVQRIDARTRTLAGASYLGRPGRVADTRELVITSTPFIVAYRIIGDRVEILAVFHGARIWPDTF